ncbi:FAD binding domain-containing protein [Bdellovibrio bacteriovorus]|uniref:xanthine dehydrogenase small subunit n=1 Tax=Bdellovibrio bacteriovorus TaxID=959 RepID=UPI0021D1389C|nr:FAD binding domain-containing protein [Bdellovibrio bacteriovorus]UXR66232.1 FAD binding domain-containing protein [Bdellovibrio bacteriovorus]
MADSKIRNEIHVFINGVEHRIGGEKAFLPLAQYLRTHSLPGTKVVCAEGDCGACTVLASKLKQTSAAAVEWTSFQTINSCIAPMYLFDMGSLVTVEGLSEQEELNEVQDQMRAFHGGQCGYCTPGMVCALSSLAESSHCSGKNISEKKARNHLTGNLCRCTGYEPILQAATHLDLSKWKPLKDKYLTASQAQGFAVRLNDSLMIEAGSRRFSAPASFTVAVDQKNQSPETRLVAGATDLGVLHNKGKVFLDNAMSLHKIADTEKIDIRADGVWVGARVTLTQLENFVANTLPELSRLLRIFASPQIKNQGTLVGNVMNGSPIGDSIPALLALEARVHLQSVTGLREVPLSQFYKAYKVFDVKPNEIATGVLIPVLGTEWKSRFFKVSLRKDLDISAVTFAAALKLDGTRISEARFAMGGVGPTVVRLPELEKAAQGQKFSEALFADLGKQVRSLIKPISDLRASHEYRLKVAENLFKKCHLELEQEIPCP